MDYKPVTLDNLKFNYLDSDRRDYMVYSPEIVDIIRDYELAGNFPYNLDIERLASEKLLQEQYSDSNRVLSHIVYCTQSYYDKIKQEASNAAKIVLLQQEGYNLMSHEQIREFAGKKTYFSIAPKLDILESKYRVEYWGNQNQCIFIKVRVKKTGILVPAFCWVKLVK